MDGILSLTMTQFNPETIQCRGLSEPSPEDCMQALNQMPATLTNWTFGKEGEADIDFVLPYVLYPPGK